MSSEVSAEKVGADFHEFAQSENGVVIDDADRKAREKALVRKLDLFIAPVMMLLQLISYLDRGNIGFAATQGMTKDIHLKGTNLNVCVLLSISRRHHTNVGEQTAVSVFYIFYILAEFPSAIYVKRIKFNIFLPFITFAWGIVCLSTGFIHSFGALVATRVLLGFFEGCLFAAMTIFLCNWYKREELGVRIAFLFGKSCVMAQKPSLGQVSNGY